MEQAEDLVPAAAFYRIGKLAWRARAAIMACIAKATESDRD
jgi:hypothetical protein